MALLPAAAIACSSPPGQTVAALGQNAVITARCEIDVHDVYGHAMSGVYAMLSLHLDVLQDTDAQPDFSVTGVTGSNGHVSMAVTAPPGSFYNKAVCNTTASVEGDTPYATDFSRLTYADDDTMAGSAVIVPRPTTTVSLPGGGTADLYASGSYDKPIVIAQPIDTSEPVRGRASAAGLWIEYNGNPEFLSGGGLLARLYSLGYDIWLFRPRSTGDDLFLQATDFARATQRASAQPGYNNAKVVGGGFSLGGLVVRTAMSRWTWDPTWRAANGLNATPPVNLIVALDAPLRGALVNNDLQHAFWDAPGDNGKTAHEDNMDSCAAQQMLENACHKVAGGALECNDRGWFETFFRGNSFSYCNAYNQSCSPNGGMTTCGGVGALLTHPNGGWPAGIRKIAASLGKIGERTGVCYGDAPGDFRDKRSDGSDGCRAAGAATFDFGTEWGYISIAFYPDLVFKYQRVNASSDPARSHVVDELAAGSRQPASVEFVSVSRLGFPIANGHQFLHAGTFIPLTSALDIDPATNLIPFDEYWTNSYDAFHDLLTDNPGTWVNQVTPSSGSLSLVDWLIKNFDAAFAAPPTGGGCGEASCVPVQGMYVSHYAGSGCTGTESYYLPYDDYTYACRTWDGTGQCGTIHRTVTNYSARINGGPCQDLWPSGNTLSDFVTVYR